MKKVIAVVVVLIVIVAAVAAAVVIGGDKKESSVDVNASLAVMGNANGDSKIDDKDLEVIEKIISGELNAADYPLADADNTGKVDQADLDLVKKMIAHESGIKINVVCDKAGVQYIQQIEYPLKNTVVIGTNLLSTMINVGCAENVCGYSKTNYGVAHAPIIDHATLLGGSITDLSTDEAKTNFSNLDTKVGVDAIITMPSASYLKTSESYLSSVPILRIDSSDGMESIGGALTIGYIHGEESEKISYKFAEKSYEVLNQITEKVKDLTDDQRKTFMAITMGFYISEKDSPYTGVGEYAGGVTVSQLDGDGSEKIKDGDTYYYGWKPDYIISFRTMDFSIDYTDISTGTTLTPAETWEKYAKYFDMLGDSYKNMVYVNTSMPVICRMAYVAEIFYPEIFGDGYGDKVWQSFVDEFLGYLGDDFDVSKDMTTLITYDMVVNA